MAEKDEMMTVNENAAEQKTKRQRKKRRKRSPWIRQRGKRCAE